MERQPGSRLQELRICAECPEARPYSAGRNSSHFTFCPPSSGGRLVDRTSVNTGYAVNHLQRYSIVFKALCTWHQNPRGKASHYIKWDSAIFLKAPVKKTCGFHSKISALPAPNYFCAESILFIVMAWLTRHKLFQSGFCNL